MKPDARRERLLLEEVGEELVVYDLERHRAHQLNRTAALVWQSCDGHKTVADLKRVLQNELNPAADEVIVRKALDRLGKARLLREPITRPAGMTRRQALGKFGQGAALAFLVPVVTSITAPTPLQAAHRPPHHEFLCDAPPCSGACRDQCKSDGDCPRGNPLCRLFPCSNPNCGRCIQRRCTKRQTPFQIRPVEI
jgi:Coenzyme PQQ synthesis protein D (PqqD)